MWVLHIYTRESWERVITWLLFQTLLMGFSGGSEVKNPSVKQEMWVQSLGQEDPLERKQQSTPVFLSGKSHGQRYLEGYSSWGRKKSWTGLTQQLNNNNSSITLRQGESFKCQIKGKYYRGISEIKRLSLLQSVRQIGHLYLLIDIKSDIIPLAASSAFVLGHRYEI